MLGQDGYGDFSRAEPSDLPMLDLVMAVRDPMAWHRANLRRNPRHYSAVGACYRRWMAARVSDAITTRAGRFGPRFVVHLQDAYGAKVYYNTMVRRARARARARP